MFKQIGRVISSDIRAQLNNYLLNVIDLEAEHARV